jgi:hypothetical protein
MFSDPFDPASPATMLLPPGNVSELKPKSTYELMLLSTGRVGVAA